MPGIKKKEVFPLAEKPLLDSPRHHSQRLLVELQLYVHLLFLLTEVNADGYNAGLLSPRELPGVGRMSSQQRSPSQCTNNRSVSPGHGHAPAVSPRRANRPPVSPRRKNGAPVSPRAHDCQQPSVNEGMCSITFFLADKVLITLSQVRVPTTATRLPDSSPLRQLLEQSTARLAHLHMLSEHPTTLLDLIFEMTKRM